MELVSFFLSLHAVLFSLKVIETFPRTIVSGHVRMSNTDDYRQTSAGNTGNRMTRAPFDQSNFYLFH